MKLILSFFAATLCVAAAEPTTDIKLDQAGYLPNAPKVAAVAAKSPAKTFTVRAAGGGKVMFKGTLSEPADDADSGDRVQLADFTKLNRPGVYYLEVPGVGTSWEFRIGLDVYRRAWYLAMRSYYGQRCGIAVDLGKEFPGYHHESCHTDAAWHPSSGKTGQAPPSALDNLHYLLGRNTFSLSWVTQVGQHPFRHPHHRPSGADENPEPWPGLLSGGPNGHKQDAAMRKLPDVPPARMYLDEQDSYASNEVAINWNAPLIFLLSAVLPD